MGNVNIVEWVQLSVALLTLAGLILKAWGFERRLKEEWMKDVHAELQSVREDVDERFTGLNDRLTGLPSAIATSVENHIRGRT